MLFTLNLLPTHLSFKLNRNIYYFLLKISEVNARTPFRPYDSYFRPEFLDRLQRSSALETRFERFFNAFKRLNVAAKQSVIATFRTAQDIENILDDVAFNGHSIKLSALPASIRQPTTELFIYLYENTLKRFGKREHYQTLYDQLASKVCPFCGLEKLNSPDLYNQDYDHILYKSDYPFASVNMRNLIPMGRDCNQVYKRTTDVLYDEVGARRRFLYPYTLSESIRYSLDGSVLPSGGTDKGNWQVSITPANDYTKTWDAVFKITQRCIKNELEPFFDQWLGVFKSYVSKKKKDWTEQEIREELQITGESLTNNPLDTSNGIKGALFLFLAEYQDQNFYNALITEINS